MIRANQDATAVGSQPMAWRVNRGCAECNVCDSDNRSLDVYTNGHAGPDESSLRSKRAACHWSSRPSKHRRGVTIESNTRESSLKFQPMLRRQPPQQPPEEKVSITLGALHSDFDDMMVHKSGTPLEEYCC